MKKSFLLFFCFSITLLPFLSLAQETGVTFKVTIKSTEDIAIPTVYVKIYEPGKEQASDSLFSSKQGVIDHLLSFTTQTSTSDVYEEPIESIITKKLYPTIIDQSTKKLSIEYNYAGLAKLNFVDIQGKNYSNHSELKPGVYFYYLILDNNSITKYHKLILAEKRIVNVELISVSSSKNRGSATSSKLKSVTNEAFYVELIKDGYITKRDTVLIEGTTIVKSYKLSEADNPTASFSFSGNLQVGEAVVFNASGSSSANGEDLVYSWDFGDEKKGQSIGIPHIYDLPGDYSVTLTVAGNYGAKHSISKNITITDGPTSSSENGSLTAFINDEALFALSGVKVSLVEGDITGTTNSDGEIELTNLPIGIPIHFTISKNGYVNQVVEITIPDDTEEALFYSTLKAKGTIVSLANAEFGGKVEGNEGTSVELPIEGLLKQDGSVATGDVTVSITPVDVANETQSFPGTFNAYRQNGESGVLLSYGVSDFSFKQGTEKLQLADGKTASIVVPIYTSGAQVGDKIDLWSVNETNGSWVQEGSGIVIASDDSPTGLALKAIVGHFSWWNCDDFAEDDEKQGKCYKWVCDDWGKCFKTEVPCWVDGKRNPGTEQKSTSAHKRIKADEEVPPVFEVRTYLPAQGKKLIFPVNSDIYIRASHKDEDGEYYRGEYTVGAADVDSFEIELTKLELEDSLSLPLNKILEYYLYKRTTYTVDIPSPKLYYLYYKSGSTPALNGKFILSDNTGVLSTGNINWYNNYVYASYDNIYITIDGKSAEDEGYFHIGFFEPEISPIEISDSIGTNLTSENHIKIYGLRATENTVATIKFYEQEGADGGGLLRFISPIGEELEREGMQVTPKMFTKPIRKDSTYLLEIDAHTESSYGIIVTTKEEEQFDITYGDTVDASLAVIGEVDMYHFTGQKDDLISILITHPYGLNQARYEFWDEDGNKLGERKLFYGTARAPEQEIVFKIPKSSKYSIVIYTEGNYTGDYQLILNKLDYRTLNYNACNIYEPADTNIRYFEVEIPDGKNTCFSFISFESSGYGNFDIFNPYCERINDNYHRSFINSMYYSYAGDEPQGKYFVKITNNNASKICMNIFEATSLVYNNKGLSQLQNTFSTEGEVNVYQTNIKPGDGIHAVMKTVNGETPPEATDLYFYPLNEGGDPAYLTESKIHYYTLDSTILMESSGKVIEDDTTWIVMATGTTTGQYELFFHKVEKSTNITVDDDFAQYPDATTSSHVAAGYAIEDNGTILIANGEYFAYSSMKIESDAVEVHGQSKESVLLANVWNKNNEYSVALDFMSANGHVHDLTFGGGNRDYYSITARADNITIEDIAIKKYDENISLIGELRVIGNNMTLRNIFSNGSYRGFRLRGNNALIKNCSLICRVQGIDAAGSHFTIKNNQIQLSEGNRAIYHSGGQGQGNNIVDSNSVTINHSSFGSEGIITVGENGMDTDNFTTSVRGNTIESSSDFHGFWFKVGNPPSQLIAENNTFKCTYPTGGKAFWLFPGRSDGTSTILVRNNTFDGLSSRNGINLSNPEYLSENQQFGIYNNCFRLAAGSEQNVSHGFIETFSDPWTPFTDTASFYIANNIFEGNGISSFMKCNSDLSLYSDYSVIYNFGGYITGSNGTLIGTTNDQTGDPLYINSDLHIGPGSPAINNGASPVLFPLIPLHDKTGAERPINGVYDIGAFETN